MLADLEAVRVEVAAEIGPRCARVSTAGYEAGKRAALGAMVVGTRLDPGEIGTVVSNAGHTHTQSRMEAVSKEDFRRAFDVNFAAHIYTATLIMPRVKAVGNCGAIVKTSSTAVSAPAWRRLGAQP